jgi:hypothetical protein
MGILGRKTQGQWSSHGFSFWKLTFQAAFCFDPCPHSAVVGRRVGSSPAHGWVICLPDTEPDLTAHSLSCQPCLPPVLLGQ